MKMKIEDGIWNMGYGRKAAYILSGIFYILNAPAFAAPFGSWIDVKAECGAVGDGKTDDTAAIQKGLDLLRPERAPRKILYFPAGSYRITSTMNILRSKHEESQGIGLQGEGSDQTRILWAGPVDAPMLQDGSWYSTIRGIGFEVMEGMGHASAGILRGPEFSTGNEVADCAFRNLAIGIQAGSDKTAGQAETCVRRCVFEKCGTGISVQNWNSLDWWIWDCVFNDCEMGVSNNPGCGAFNVYRSRFNSSMKADVRMGNLDQFALVGNSSKNSGCFLAFEYGPAAGANITLQGNRIERPKASDWIGNSGPALILDNQYLLEEGSTNPAVAFAANNQQAVPGNAVLIGNTTSAKEPVRIDRKGYAVRVVPTEEEFSWNGPSDETQEKTERSMGAVIEVKTGAGAGEIQAALDQATDGSVVHLSPGKYAIDRPLKITGGKRVTFRGDGILNATTVVRGSDFEGDALVICEGAQGVVIQDMAIGGSTDAGGSAGLLIQTKDQPGIAVKGDQVQSYGYGPGLVVQGLDEARVVLENHGHNGVTVFGGPNSKLGKRGGATVEILQGASSRAGGLRPDTPIYDVRGGGRMLVRDIWYEGQGQVYLKLTDRGDFLQCGNRIAPYKIDEGSGKRAIMMDGKAGQVLLAQCAPHGADLTIGKMVEGFYVTLLGLTPYGGAKISYADEGNRISQMGDGISKADGTKGDSNSMSNIQNPISNQAGFMQVACRNNNTKGTGSEPLGDVNPDGDLGERLKILRQWKLPDPAEAAAVSLHRVSCRGGVGMVVVSLKPKADKK